MNITMSINLSKEINVYYLFIPLDFREVDATNLVSKLTETEQCTFFNKTRELNRLQFLFGRLLIQNSLLEKEDKVELTNYGKPFISGKSHAHISITHSNRLVVIVISYIEPVGIDTEFVRPIN